MPIKPRQYGFLNSVYKDKDYYYVIDQKSLLRDLYFRRFPKVIFFQISPGLVLIYSYIRVTNGLNVAKRDYVYRMSTSTLAPPPFISQLNGCGGETVGLHYIIDVFSMAANLLILPLPCVSMTQCRALMMDLASVTVTVVLVHLFTYIKVRANMRWH